MDDVEGGAQTVEVSASVRGDRVGLGATLEEEQHAPPAEVTHTARLVKTPRGFGIKVDFQNKVTLPLTLNPKP